MTRTLQAFNAIVLTLGLLSTTGCLIPIYSALPERRVQQLLYTSEDLRNIIDEWERFWMVDQPSHLSPVRIHGGII